MAKGRRGFVEGCVAEEDLWGGWMGSLTEGSAEEAAGCSREEYMQDLGWERVPGSGKESVQGLEVEGVQGLGSGVGNVQGLGKESVQDPGVEGIRGSGAVSVQDPGVEGV